MYDKGWGAMDRSKYLTTGELARLAHVTKNTLFHYDKIGLFSPEIVLENEYRYYSIHQVEVLNAIVLLRDLGMPLAEIRTFLEGRNPEKLLTLLEEEGAQIQKQMKILKERSLWIKGKMEKVQNILAIETDRIYVRTQSEIYYVINNVEDMTDMAYAEKIMELTERYENCNHSTRYEIGNIQQLSDIRQGIYDNYRNVVLVMKKKPAGMPYGSMPAGDYLVAYYKGHWKGIGTAYERMMKYAHENGLKLSERFLETYAVDSLMAEREEDYVTEISVRLAAEKLDYK